MKNWKIYYQLESGEVEEQFALAEVAKAEAMIPTDADIQKVHKQARTKATLAGAGIAVAGAGLMIGSDILIDTFL